ncbi:hypothetical protein L917_09326 [Phytophthora nicotianae]|uniref:Uncharacterized protein n=1 Tax=Phytophthora nicotianae TaxID=4792 RepID=W2L6Q9_PHYNI|nr:hypothetical protein L917_09326 [Phytophthora nicotianae]
MTGDGFRLIHLAIVDELSSFQTRGEAPVGPGAWYI